MEVLKLTTVGKVIASGKLDLLEFLLYITHYALYITSLHIEPYDDTALTSLTADLGRTQLILNRSDLTHGNLSVLSGHHHILHIVNSCTVEAIEAYHQIKTAFVLEDHSRTLTCKGCAKHLIGLLDGKPIIGQAQAIVSDANLGKACYLFHVWGGSPLYFLNQLAYLLGIEGEGIHILPEDLDCHILSDTCH